MTFEEILMQYALPAVCMALIVIVLVGIVKIFTKMIPSKESKLSKIMSHLYVVMAPIFSFGVVCAYFAIFHFDFDWIEIAKQCGVVWSCSQAMYPIYRDLGGRALLLKVLAMFKGKSAKADDIIALIENVIVLSSKQKESIKKEIDEKL